MHFLYFMGAAYDKYKGVDCNTYIVYNMYENIYYYNISNLHFLFLYCKGLFCVIM